MQKDIIRITLTEFMDFIKKSGEPKVNHVRQIKNERMTEYSISHDYWSQFRKNVVRMLKKEESNEYLKELLESVSEDKRSNYQRAINGFLLFKGKKKFVWHQPPKKQVLIGDVKVSLNPEIGYSYRGNTYYVKLFIRTNDILEKKHAKLILCLMNDKMSDKLMDNVHFAVLDVMRGKLHTFDKKDPKVNALLRAEAKSFASMWNEM